MSSFKNSNRRAAIVFIHPNTTPPGSDAPKLSLPYGLVEFVMDTTRAVTNLLYSGAFERYPRIRFIISHAGGAIPYIAWRLKLGEMSPVLRERVPKGALHYLQQLYFDTALSSSEYAFAALREFAQPTHILFGSDYPMAPEPILRAEVAGLETSRIFDEAARKAISRDNALRLFPRFRAGDATCSARAAPADKFRREFDARFGSKQIQYCLAAVFFVLGGWCLIAPGSVMELAIRPAYWSDAPLVPILIGAFGAQALIAGLFAAFSTFTRMTFLVYGIALLPFFVFDWWFYFRTRC